MRYDSKIPANWKCEYINTLLADIGAGVSVNGHDEPASNGELGVLKLGAVAVGGGFNPNENKAIKAEEIGRVGPTVTKGTLLLSRSNTIDLVGACTAIQEDYPCLHVPDLLWVVQPESGCDLLWLQYLIAARPVRRGVRAIATGTSGSMMKLSMQAFRKIEVPVPPLSEQRKIAAILSTWDRASELTEKLIAAKRKRKQALMQQLLTGKVRLQEFVKSKKRRTTLLGEMPVDWNEYRLKNLVEKVKRKNPDDVQHVLTASGEFGLVDQREFFNRSVASSDLSGYYLLRRGEYAYNRSAMKGYPFGAIKRLDRYDQGVLSTLYICFGVTVDHCNLDYLSHLFEARLLDRQLRRVTQVGGRAHGLLNITESDFYGMTIVLPSEVEQRAIAKVVDCQQREIDLLLNKLDALQRQKRGLMQQLLTGKVRVNSDAIKDNPE